VPALKGFSLTFGSSRLRESQHLFSAVAGRRKVSKARPRYFTKAPQMPGFRLFEITDECRIFTTAGAGSLRRHRQFAGCGELGMLPAPAGPVVGGACAPPTITGQRAVSARMN
jgi:hypothetical protein